jgi:hypothetical protein
MNIGQDTVERLLYVLLLIVFLAIGVVYLKIAHDDAKKFYILKSNQAQIICIVKGIYDPANYKVVDGKQIPNTAFIDSCVKKN